MTNTIHRRIFKHIPEIQHFSLGDLLFSLYTVIHQKPKCPLLCILQTIHDKDRISLMSIATTQNHNLNFYSLQFHRPPSPSLIQIAAIRMLCGSYPVQSSYFIVSPSVTTLFVCKSDQIRHQNLLKPSGSAEEENRILNIQYIQNILRHTNEYRSNLQPISSLLG